MTLTAAPASPLPAPPGAPPERLPEAPGATFFWARDGAALAALKPHWDELLERCETRSPFLRWDWIWNWWLAHKPLFQPAVCVAVEDGRVAGIAPFAVGREDRGTRRGMRQLGFLAGLGEGQGERLNVLLPADRVEDLAPTLLARLADLRGEWDAVRLNRVPAESAILPHLLRALRGITQNCGILNAVPCRFLSMEYASWEDFEAARSRNWRRNAKRLRKQLVEELAVSYHSGAVTLTGEDVFEALVRLHGTQFPPEESHFISERALRMHRLLMPKWLAEGRADLAYLAAGERVLSAVLFLREGADAYAFQVGRDTSCAEASVGRAAFDHAVEHAFHTGARCMDFLAGDYEYKRRWTSETRTVLDLEGYAPESWRAKLFLGLRWVKRWLADLPDEDGITWGEPLARRQGDRAGRPTCHVTSTAAAASQATR